MKESIEKAFLLQALSGGIGFTVSCPAAGLQLLRHLLEKYKSTGKVQPAVENPGDSWNARRVTFCPR